MRRMRGLKICELKIKDVASLNAISQALVLNGYIIESAVIYKEFPQSGIDCFMIAVFDREEKENNDA